MRGPQQGWRVILRTMNPSDPIIALPPAWQHWLRDNVARGCTHHDLAAALRGGGWSEAVIATALRSVGVAVAPAATAAAAPVGAGVNPRAAAGWSSFPRDGNVLPLPDRRVAIGMRLADPCVALALDLLDAAECDELVRRAQAKLQRSAIVDPATGQARVIAERSSEGTFFQRNEDAFIARLDARIAAFMHWPVDHGEGIQILHYGVGGEYRPHFDYFPAQDPGSAAHLAHGGQRVGTLVMYLNDVSDGGGTHFPALGLTVLPRKGAAVYFESCTADGLEDPRSLHAGLPVLAGEKWIATKWMRMRPYV